MMLTHVPNEQTERNDKRIKPCYRYSNERSRYRHDRFIAKRTRDRHVAIERDPE